MIRLGGHSVIEVFYQINFDRIINIHASKKKLSRLIEYILTLMSKNDKCKDTFLQLSKQSVSNPTRINYLGQGVKDFVEGHPEP